MSWTPATELSDPFVPNPVATYTTNDNVVSYLVKAVTPFGCFGTATVNVKIFKTKPDIFVPNAFTPGLAMNALFRPIPVGITSLEYFRVYNRLGQLVYNTSTIGNGWDGNLNGSPQNAGGYVWMVKGTGLYRQCDNQKRNHGAGSMILCIVDPGSYCLLNPIRLLILSSLPICRDIYIRLADVC